MRKMIPLIIVLVVVTVIIFLFIKNGTEINTTKEGDFKKNQNEGNPYQNADLLIEIIPGVNNTYGYNILVNGRILIHQPHIPGLPGTEGFKTEGQAREVAELVINKIRKNQFPPSVSLSELDSLEAL